MNIKSWNQLWIVSSLGIIVSALFLFITGYTTLGGIMLLATSVFFVFEITYFIRVRHSISFKKAIYVAFGVGIGCAAWIIYVNTITGYRLIDTFGFFPSQIISFAVLCTSGALVGDWIGKKRNKENKFQGIQN
jgi:hypothetical protein